MSENAEEPWPSEINLKENGRLFRIRFENGDEYNLSAEYLRVMSPSAELQGHRASERKTLGGKRHCWITAITPVGTYAVRLTFDDGHATGIYTWRYLHELGSRHADKWAVYEAELAAKGLTRDKPGEA